MKHCDKCRLESKIVLPYGPHSFCENHFLDFFEKRVRKTTRAKKMVLPKEKIAVGLSGGKDSATTLFLLKKIFSNTNEIEAVMIDEGIKGYRDKSIEAGKKLCKQLDVPFTIRDFKKEFGYSMEEIQKKIEKNSSLGGTCSFCGVFRKQLLNKLALEVGAQKLATGHNLDDEAQSIAMNFFEASLQKIVKQNSQTQQNKFFVPRIKPLLSTPEKDVIAFCAFTNLKHFSGECCPFSSQAKRNNFRQLLNNLEAEIPSTKFSLLQSFEKIAPLIKNKTSLSWTRCSNCSKPSSGKVCTVCSKLKKLKENKKTSFKKLQKKEITKKKNLSCAMKYSH